MGVLVAEAPKSFSLVSARAKEAGGVAMGRRGREAGHFGQDEAEADDDEDAAYRRRVRAVAAGPEQQPVPAGAQLSLTAPDKDKGGLDSWAPAAPPRPKKKWIRHFLNGRSLCACGCACVREWV
ncbi:putative ATP-binding protein MJ0169 [Frankliniella fusca]|uniref:ATP-binding protein MJ0169 n=1 Tax=Frankliniella fusca TaxID=407009 RepID=A0AAE1L6R0_9NEOP|nr:putative ATP-binding protein MJ0169 [Frankliniella fusca]